MSEEIKKPKEEEKAEDKAEEKPKTRKLLIETNGTTFQVTHNSLAGNLELRALLEAILKILEQK